MEQIILGTLCSLALGATGALWRVYRNKIVATEKTLDNLRERHLDDVERLRERITKMEQLDPKIEELKRDVKENTTATHDVRRLLEGLEATLKGYEKQHDTLNGKVDKLLLNGVRR